MTIANPIYDTVFKYLLEDIDIAKGLLSAILGVEIISLTLLPQETISETEESYRTVRVYRIDFAAVIEEADGTFKKVLIELQKTKRGTNIGRFRRYLAENYQREDRVLINGVETKQSLELITIYFLGFNLENVPASVLQVKKTFIDASTGEIVSMAKQEDFVKLLTHESYIIQLLRLTETTQNHLERVLSVFNQAYQTADAHLLNYQKEAADPLVARITHRLMRAIADEQLRRKMDVEDEIEREFQEIEAKNKVLLQEAKQIIEEKDQELGEAKQELGEAKQELGEAKQELGEARQVIEEKDKKIEEYLKMIEALKKNLDTPNNP